MGSVRVVGMRGPSSQLPLLGEVPSLGRFFQEVPLDPHNCVTLVFPFPKPHQSPTWFFWHSMEVGFRMHPTQGREMGSPGPPPPSGH